MEDVFEIAERLTNLKERFQYLKGTGQLDIYEEEDMLINIFFLEDELAYYNRDEDYWF